MALDASKSCSAIIPLTLPAKVCKFMTFHWIPPFLAQDKGDEDEEDITQPFLLKETPDLLGIPNPRKAHAAIYSTQSQSRSQIW
eukprot:CAMPEP_0184740498 /NCGR_PEP_ID=MMETSP0315-20130426/3499_1 /TAXON_ID=101924 /ORGANISM="Rhodosorus marinus, Strain UTEX LB 2760" /LENGTH=83 /DNA_ID=CAMNT_0027210191 /DNA_START=2003 /DNA_END=2251 /DNA_ORIENTATION=+